MILVYIAVGVILAGIVFAFWWHNRVVANNERLRNLFGVTYQKFHVYQDMSEGKEKTELGEELLDVLSDPDCSKAEKWLNEPGNVTYLSSAFVNH